MHSELLRVRVQFCLLLTKQPVNNILFFLGVKERTKYFTMTKKNLQKALCPSLYTLYFGVNADADRSVAFDVKRLEINVLKNKNSKSQRSKMKNRKGKKSVAFISVFMCVHFLGKIMKRRHKIQRYFLWFMPLKGARALVLPSTKPHRMEKADTETGEERRKENEGKISINVRRLDGKNEQKRL